jgi:hypothetical protein
LCQLLKKLHFLHQRGESYFRCAMLQKAHTLLFMVRDLPRSILDVQKR